jgi:hypothetical protein
MSEASDKAKTVAQSLAGNVFAVTTINNPGHSGSAGNEAGLGFAVCKAGNFIGTDITPGGRPLEQMALGAAAACPATTTMPASPLPNIEKMAVDARSDGQVGAAAVCKSGAVVTDDFNANVTLGPGSQRSLTQVAGARLNRKCIAPGV